MVFSRIIQSTDCQALKKHTFFHFAIKIQLKQYFTKIKVVNWCRQESPQTISSCVFPWKFQSTFDTLRYVASTVVSDAGVRWKRDSRLRLAPAHQNSERQKTYLERNV